MQCDCEVNNRANCIEIPNIDENLNTNIYSLDIRDLRIIKADVNLLYHLFYKSENMHNGEHWILYDNVHSHFHVITDIRKFLGSNV